MLTGTVNKKYRFITYQCVYSTIISNLKNIKKMPYLECVMAEKTVKNYLKMSFIKAYIFSNLFTGKTLALANSESKLKNHMKLILCFPIL